MENIILVDEKDRQIGIGEKMEVHKNGQLHRAFSIFIFNGKNELLLQRRALSKYHSPGLWSNTCCGHPKHGESILDAAHRRLGEEMGFDTELEDKFSFHYKVKLDDLFEHEIDHVIIGKLNDDDKIKSNPEEAADWIWIKTDSFRKELKENPKNYTFWVKIAFEELDKSKDI